MHYQPNLLIQALSGFLDEKKSGKGCVTCSKTWSTQKTGDVSHRSMHRQQFPPALDTRPVISEPSALTLRTAGANFIHNPIDPLLPPCRRRQRGHSNPHSQFSALITTNTNSAAQGSHPDSGQCSGRIMAFYGLHIV